MKTMFGKWDLLIFVGAVAAAQLLLRLYEPLAFILLGGALILFAPFVILERYGLPLVKNRPRLAVVVALAFITLGGVCWLLAAGMMDCGCSLK